MDISIVGVGNVGGALAIALSRSGHKIQQLIVKSRRSANSIVQSLDEQPLIQTFESFRLIKTDLIFICTADPDIGSAAQGLASQVRPGQIVLHTSGSLTSEILKPLIDNGCEAGSMHPLVSISDPFRGSKRFAGAYFCIEGSKNAKAVARRVVKSLSGMAFTVPTAKKALYHASAVTVAGHLVALFDTGVEMLMKCGLKRKAAERILLPLTQSTIENLSSQPVDKALTGTFARLDKEGLALHIDAVKEIPGELRDVYLSLGERSLSLMESSGIKDPRTAAMRRMIFIAKGKHR